MNSKTQILIQGFGYSARTFHIPLISQFPQAQLRTLVSSRSPNDIPEGLFSQIQTDYQRALEDSKVDLVVLTGPNQTHGSMAELALLAGKDVLVEKPFTTSFQQAWDLIQLAKQNQRKIHVFQNRRLDGDFLTIQKALDSEGLGKIKRVESRMDRYRPMFRARWKESDTPGSGVAWDLGAHLIDQVLLLFGLPREVWGDLRTQRDGGKGVDGFDIAMSYSWGTAFLGSSSFCHSRPSRFRLETTKGSYQVLGLDPQEELLKGGTPGTQDFLWESNEGQPAPQILEGEYLALYQEILAGGAGYGPALPAVGIYILEQLHQKRSFVLGSDIRDFFQQA